jgi:hypothetical protein
VELSKLLIGVTECYVDKEKDGNSHSIGKKGCGSTPLPNKIQIKEHRILVSCRMNKKIDNLMKGNGMNMDTSDFAEKVMEEK